MNGYADTILRVDLSTGAIKKEPTPEDWKRDYVGGRGFCTKIIYDEVPAGADTLGPENKVVLATGPLTGTFMPACCRTAFAAKSPATGGYGDALVGGHLGAEIKFAGYDAIIIEGAASKPSYIYIDDDKVEIRDAAKYWGQGTTAAEQTIKKDIGEDFQVAIIGPAGENRVVFACVSHDFGRQAGRTGIGAVMGSKNLKAVAIRGSKAIPVADVEAMIQVGSEMYKFCMDKPVANAMRRYGTQMVTTWVNSIGAFPTKNYSASYFPFEANLEGEVFRKLVVSDKGCYGCPFPCGKYSKVQRDGKDVLVEGPEYETSALLGSNCYVPNVEDVIYLNYVYDEMGLDTISGGSVAAFATECFERGIITTDDTGGLELKFGDVEAIAKLAEMIAYRKGIGDILAQGTRHAAYIFDKGAPQQAPGNFAIQNKGLEWSGYESRSAPAMLLSYMTCDIGAHHSRSWAIVYDINQGRDKLETKPEKVVELQHVRPMFDTLGICRFSWVELDVALAEYPKMLKAVTGRDISLDDLLKVSERQWNLVRAYWTRELRDFGRAYDIPPKRFMTEAIPDGPSKGAVISREKVDWLLDRYYEIRGWTKNGIPTPEKLRELGLEQAAQDIEAR